MRPLLTAEKTVGATLVRLADQVLPPPVLSEADCKAIRQADMRQKRYRTVWGFAWSVSIA